MEMWELNRSGSYFKWEGEGEDRNLVASLIHHGPEDGANPNRWGVQINTEDGGLVVMGYIPDDLFDTVLAQAIADSALTEKQNYDWWIANGEAWFAENTITA